MFTRSIAAAGLLAAAGFAHATTVDTGFDSWQVFDVADVLAADGGLGWIDVNDGSALSFTFTVPTGSVGRLTVVDAGFAGDRFDVSVNGSPLAATSAAVDSYPDSIGLDFDAALADPRFSRGVYQLSAGHYTVTGALLSSALDDTGSPINATVGGLMVGVSPVPEPQTWALMAAGAGLLGLLVRRRVL